MNPDNNLPDVILTLIIVGVILFVGIAAVSATIDTSDGAKEQVSKPALLDGTTVTEIDDNTGTDEEVYNSLGNAVELSGANDSYYQSTSDINAINDSTWTVSTWATVDADAANDTMTTVSLGGDLVVYYNGSTDSWAAWFYDDGARNSYHVNVSASSPTDGLNNIIVERDGDNLTIYRNTTAGSSADLSNTSTASSPHTTNWHGRIDEVRTDDVALNASQRNQIYQNPVAPLTGTDKTARIMFDEPEQNKQLLFFSGGDIQLYNATIVDGHPGELMDGESFANSLAGATDYEWGTDGPQIRAVEGGQLDGAPVAYAEYTSYGLVGGLVSDYQNALVLAGVVFILVPLGAIIMFLRGTKR